MKKKTKQKLLNGCISAVVVFSSALSPLAVSAATTSNASSTVSRIFSRISGADRYTTAAKIAQQGWSGTCKNVVLSSGSDGSLVDALAAGPLAAQLKAPILLTDNGSVLNSAAKAELQRLQPTKVYITGGLGVIKQSVLDEIQGMGMTLVQLGGADRYETSVNIMKEMANQGADLSKIVMAAGWSSPADALSVAPIAAARKMPILATTQDQLPSVVKTYLDSIKDKISESYVVGGTAAVSDAVKAQLPGKVSRFAGQTRYDTNAEVLKGLANDYKNDKVYIANGESLVDALASVPLAAGEEAPVVLVNQQPDKAVKDFVKLNMSTADLVAIGGEGAVSDTEMNDLTSDVTYSTDSAVLGSTDASKPLELTDNVQITGNTVTLENAQADYSVYLKGNDITLSNLNVKGTVFIDPGDTGSATLDGVTAAKIVVLSGASDSIHIINSTANTLTVDSSSKVHVEAAGTTSINNTVVRTFSVIDANGGSMGQVVISSTPGQTPVVELRGTFTQPIEVSGQAELQAASGAVIPSVVINPGTPDQAVTLSGSYSAVEVQSPCKLVLSAATTVAAMKTTAQAEITVPQGSSISSLDSGTSGTVVSGGGTVNGQSTGTTPSTPTTGTGSTGSTGSSGGSSGGGGGGGGGGGTSTTTYTQIATYTLDNGTPVTLNGTSATIDLSASSGTSTISSLQITGNPADSTLVLTGITSPKTGSISGTVTSPTNQSNSLLFSSQTFTLPKTITMSDLLGSSISNGDVSVGSLRTLFGSSVTFNGTISSSGNATSNVSLTFKLE